MINALLAEELAKRHEVTVLTSQAKGLPAEIAENGVRIIRVPVFFRTNEVVANLACMLAFIPMAIHAGKKLLRREQYDIINTHFVLPTGPVGDALSRFAGIPHVLTLLGGDVYDPTKFVSPHRHLLSRSWIRHLLKRADAVVGDSQNLLENMHRFYTRDIEGIRIPLGIQHPPIHAVSRERYGFAEEEVLFVTVGGLIRRKGVGQLIDVMESFKQAPVRLVIVGSGPEEVHLRAQVKKRQLADKVIFLGHVEEDDKFSLLRLCDVYVSTSQHEGFGLVFLEAMACGLPIVCFDCGGQTDFLENRETGYVVPLNDLIAFRKYCELLFSNPRLRHRMGQSNRHRVKGFYIEHCAARYEHLFQDVLAKRASTNSTAGTFPAETSLKSTTG